MSTVRYAVFSDMHFGATNSLLTTLRPDPSSAGGFAADPSEPSPMIDAVLSGLERLTGSQDEPPTLVLAGDILDLALSPDEVAATAFGGFVDRAFGGERPVFGPVVYYLPGNHDHHLWEGTREAAYTRSLQQLPVEAPIPPPRHTTRIKPAELAPSEGDLMSALIRRRHRCAAIEVRVAYPNLAITTDAGDRIQVLSHGHFTESIYTLMTRLRQMLFPDQVEDGERSDVEVLEAENFAWIDFFWSTLGRSGEVGIDVARIYSDLQSMPRLDEVIANLAAAFTSRPHNPVWLRRVESALLRRLLRREAQHVVRAERGSPDVVLTPGGREGLRSYLEGPVLIQLKSQLDGPSTRTGFIFGHTHKPFSESWSLAGYPAPVAIANTGGWVVDTSTVAPCQGASVVLLDDELNQAELRLYQQAPGGVRPVEVHGSDPSSPLLAELRRRIDPADAPWKAVTAAAEALVAERWRLQANLVSSSTHTTG